MVTSGFGLFSLTLYLGLVAGLSSSSQLGVAFGVGSSLNAKLPDTWAVCFELSYAKNSLHFDYVH